MALKLFCEGGCGKEMRPLEPYKIQDDKYICLSCSKPVIFITPPKDFPKPAVGYYYSKAANLELYQHLIDEGWIYQGHIKIAQSIELDTFMKVRDGKSYYVSANENSWIVRNELVVGMGPVLKIGIIGFLPTERFEEFCI